MGTRKIPRIPARTRSKQRDDRAPRLAAAFRAHKEESSLVERGDDGAVLILALIFLLVVSLVITAILTWAGTSLTATGNFQTERNTEYGATAAVNLAVQTTRTTFDTGSPTPFLNNPTPELCATYGTPSFHVYCTMVWQPYSSNTRVFTYSACLSGTSGDASPTACAATPLLQARFAFYDYPSAGASISSTPQQCQPVSTGGACGQNVIQISWQWNPIVPAVTSISPAAGPITGGNTVTIRGTSFTGGESVNFVQQNPATGAYNPPVPATIVANPAPGCALPTCIQVTSPVVTSGTAYYVEVTTPGGTTPASSTSTFTYAPITPTVTSNAGTTAGTVTGGDTVTVQGTGFWSTTNLPQFPAQIFFCLVSTGACTQGSVLSVTSPGTGSTVDTMTALTPAVSVGGPYYIRVESYNLLSLPNSNVEFTYNVHVPLVISLSALSGGTGSALTITGANFLSGSTVGFCPTGSYNNNACNQGSLVGATIASPISATQVTISVPSVPAGTYYPIVTLPSNSLTQGLTTQQLSSQAYSQPADTFSHT